MAHTCPVWIGYLLLCPFRGFAHDPTKILGPHVREGMTVLDLGCAMGFFSLPLARMVGRSGKVICVDIQEKMLSKLAARAGKAGLSERILAVRATERSLGLQDWHGSVDFALAFAVAHEVPDQPRLFREISAALKPGAPLLVAEPALHVRQRSFEASLSHAQDAGLHLSGRPRVPRSHAALLVGP
jgi:ubiquinone/menaquinone biosynthesis C-methylase UbiE